MTEASLRHGIRISLKNRKERESHIVVLADRVTERELIMLFLITERIRGAGSAWYPWVSMLPQSFSTPLFFGKAELDELRGTTLHRATEYVHISRAPQDAVTFLPGCPSSQHGLQCYHGL